MSNNISNVNGINPQIPDKGAEKTLFTKEQFTNSIMSALSRAGANKTQKANFQQQAASIFTQYDTSPADNKWTRTESDNGGAQALASFYEMVNNALKGIESPASVDPTVSPEAAAAAKEFESKPFEQQVQEIKDMVKELGDAGRINPDDKVEDVVNSVVGTLSQLGVSEKTIKSLESTIIGAVNDTKKEVVIRDANDTQRRNNLIDVGLEVRTDGDGNYGIVDPTSGELIGEMYADGTMNTGALKTMIEATQLLYESQGYEFKSENTSDNGEYTITFVNKEGDVKTETFDLKKVHINQE